MLKYTAGNVRRTVSYIGALSGLLERKPTLKYGFHGSNINNFGDYLAEYFVNYVFGSPRVNLSRCNVHVIGSVVHRNFIKPALRRRKEAHFWGCGLRTNYCDPLFSHANVTIYCVRGPLSAEVLGNQELCAGDSALLLPLVYKPKSIAHYTAKHLYIPHIANSNAKVWRTGCDLVLSPSIEASKQAVEHWIDCIYSSSFVLSNSLHGAIVAYAYGKPFAFQSDGFLNCEFKWKDFAALIGCEPKFVSALAQGKRWYECNENNIKSTNCARLLNLCPYEIPASHFYSTSNGRVYIQ